MSCQVPSSSYTGAEESRQGLHFLTAPAISCSAGFGGVLSRLQKKTSPSSSSHQAPSTVFVLSDELRHSTHVDITLSASFPVVTSTLSGSLETIKLPTAIDSFTPRAFSSNFPRPTTSSRDLDSSSSLYVNTRKLYQDFSVTRSRVVRFYKIPLLSESFLNKLFDAVARVPIPVSLWTLLEKPDRDGVWVVFKSHDEARTMLSFSGPIISVEPALESDLEPFSKLKRFVMKSASPLGSNIPQSAPSERAKSLHPPLPVPNSRETMNLSDISGHHMRTDFILSTNPPNPKTSFRLGDWICPQPNCAAHNFGRNLSCIGCGCPRSNNSSSPIMNSSLVPNSRITPSPRFASANNPTPFMHSEYDLFYATAPGSTSSAPCPSPHANAQKTVTRPLLTPSGRAFAIGGRVQNISRDPLSPCIMYWPENEPFPEQGQIRPGNLSGIPQPPILNTGNRGPISHQPGDWICLKCNYLNWRRRKVCQTCLPYAEGNGDSVSAAVQAERITLLTSVLSQTCFPPPNIPPSPVNHSHSPTLPRIRPPFSNEVTSQGLGHHIRSDVDLGAQYSQSRPIYQTSGHRQPSPLYTTGSSLTQRSSTSAPLLPSFLHDIVQVPALSPSSTTSAELSLEEYEDQSSPSTMSNYSLPQVVKVFPAPLAGNIWKLDGEESKSLSGYALPNHRDLVGATRKSNHEQLFQPIVS